MSSVENVSAGRCRRLVDGAFATLLVVQTTGRRASVVLVHRGKVLGVLPPVELEVPWWPEANDLVTAVRERDGLEITVLRLLRTTSDGMFGGEVNYLAETDRPPRTALEVWPTAPLADQPLRQSWAHP